MPPAPTALWRKSVFGTPVAHRRRVKTPEGVADTLGQLGIWVNRTGNVNDRDLHTISLERIDRSKRQRPQAGLSDAEG